MRCSDSHFTLTNDSFQTESLESLLRLTYDLAPTLTLEAPHYPYFLLFLPSFSSFFSFLLSFLTSLLPPLLVSSSRVQRILGDFPLDGEMIYAALQMQAAAEVGFDDPAFGMQVLRCATTLFPGDTAMLTIPLYRRFNKSERGSLKVGDDFPDVHVVALDQAGAAVAAAAAAGVEHRNAEEDEDEDEENPTADDSTACTVLGRATAVDGSQAEDDDGHATTDDTSCATACAPACATACATDTTDTTSTTGTRSPPVLAATTGAQGMRLSEWYRASLPRRGGGG